HSGALGGLNPPRFVDPCHSPPLAFARVFFDYSVPPELLPTVATVLLGPLRSKHPLPQYLQVSEVLGEASPACKIVTGHVVWFNLLAPVLRRVAPAPGAIPHRATDSRDTRRAPRWTDSRTPR